MKINNIEYEIGIYDLEGNFIDSTDDWDVLEKEFSLNKNTVRSALAYGSLIVSTYQLKFNNKQVITLKFPLKLGSVYNVNAGGKPEKPVAKYYKNKLISIYKTILEAEEKTGITRGGICNSCNKGYKAGIYTFKYIQ